MAQTSRTFRIFISSTFSDLKEERNALHRVVYPELRKLCAESGTRFQAIDLRWGVPSEAGLDQETMKICLDEIDRSRQVSPRPNFVVLLGDRYGWRPLPPIIPEAEYSSIDALITDAADRASLAAWYRKDENARPAEYCLQPRRVAVGDGATADAIAAAHADEASQWEQVERDLTRILREAIDRLPFSDEQKLKYYASATEQEIWRGARLVADAREHVFCFFRRINSLPTDSSAGEFRDLDATGQRDVDAETRLMAIKEHLRAFPGNVHDYEATWVGGDPARSPVSTDHVARLCADVQAALTNVITKEIARLKDVESLEKEIEDHEAFRQDRSRFFTGRTATLERMRTYAGRSDRQPLALSGESGSGKSAVMAKAVDEIRGLVPQAEVVALFIGSTPGSSDIRTLLDTLCRQISRRYGAVEVTNPTEYRELVQELPKRLALASSARPLVVVLDALDQLSDAESARNLMWLPSVLPEHVSLMVSTMAPSECLTVLERRLPDANRVRLEDMRPEEGDALLELWLRDAGRLLQADQKRKVMSQFSACPKPLYLKLAFEEARRWRSYTDAPELSAGIPGIIGDLFRRCSAPTNHGALLVSRSLGYLAAAKNGLSEDELLDVLSLDPEVRQDFVDRARHTPPEPRLPVVIWSRLFFELEPYLAERSADNATLMTFYHRQLREVVEATYLLGDEKRARHRLLAEYFAPQPIETGTSTPNVRKLTELPFQQTYAELWDSLYTTLTDFDFLQAKCTHVAVVTQGTGEEARKIYGGVYELQEDYRRALAVFPAT